jgi:hypothetical protein
VNPEDQLRIPSRPEWGKNDPRDLEAEWALEQFLGKNLGDAEDLFARNALYYGEALYSMPPVPLNFYSRALASYLTSERARDDADGASSFLDTLAWILENHPQDLEPDTKALLMNAAEHVSANQTFYDADVSIYNRFSERFNRIKRLSRRPLPR